MADGLSPMFERGDRSADRRLRPRPGQPHRDRRALCPAPGRRLRGVAGDPRAQVDLVQAPGSFTERLARLIESERAAGSAPEGAEARALAASLVWTAERSFHVAAGGEHPTLVDAAAVVAPLTQLFVGTIYGRAVELRAG